MNGTQLCVLKHWCEHGLCFCSNCLKKTTSVTQTCLVILWYFSYKPIEIGLWNQLVSWFLQSPYFYQWPSSRFVSLLFSNFAISVFDCLNNPFRWIVFESMEQFSWGRSGVLGSMKSRKWCQNICSWVVTITTFFKDWSTTWYLPWHGVDRSHNLNKVTWVRSSDLWVSFFMMFGWVN